MKITKHTGKDKYTVKFRIYQYCNGCVDHSTTLHSGLKDKSPLSIIK